MQKNLRIPDDVAHQLASAAHASGQPQSKIVAEALAAYFSAPSEEDWRRQVEQRLARIEEAANL